MIAFNRLFLELQNVRKLRFRPAGDQLIQLDRSRSQTCTIVANAPPCPAGGFLPLARRFAADAEDCRWRGDLPLARGFAAGAGICRWRGDLPLAQRLAAGAEDCRWRGDLLF